MRWKRARGVKLTLPEFERPKIPDEQNFAALPLMRAAFAGRKTFDLPTQIGTFRRPRFADRFTHERVDWSRWQEYLKAAGYLAETSDDPVHDVLRGLEQFEPQIAEWRQWRRRPQSQFPHDLSDVSSISLHHLDAVRSAAYLFELQMRAHLALGDSRSAYSAFQDAFQAQRALEDEPMLISCMIRVAMLLNLMAGVGSGLQDRAWAAPELEKIARDLVEVRIWDDYRLALGSERAFFNSSFEPLVSGPRRARATQIFGAPAGKAKGGLPTTDAVMRGGFGLLPRRVFRDNQLRHNRYFDELIARVNTAGDRFYVDAPAPSSPEHLGAVEQYYFIMRLAWWGFSEFAERYLEMETQLDQTRVACALERFRLARQTYPAALSALVPQFIQAVPEDAYLRAPLRYARTEEGSFRLYSVGKNRIDDGAVINRRKTDRQQLDTIWHYAPNGSAELPTGGPKQ